MFPLDLSLVDSARWIPLQKTVQLSMAGEQQVNRGPSFANGPAGKPQEVAATEVTIWEFMAGDDPKRIAS
jgi:hypothetical protein